MGIGPSSREDKACSKNSGSLSNSIAFGITAPSGIGSGSEFPAILSKAGKCPTAIGRNYQIEIAGTLLLSVESQTWKTASLGSATDDPETVLFVTGRRNALTL